MGTLHVEVLPPCAGRTLIIGDVHGCAAELEALLAAFAPGPEDRLLAVGDLINRGPDSAGVLALARRHRIRPVLGNHEQRLLAGWLSGNPDVLRERDKPTFAQLRPEDWDWIAGWPHVLRIPSLNTLVVHGGFAPDRPWHEQDPGLVTRIQVLDARGLPARRADAPAGRPWAEAWRGPEHVVYGHTPRPQPLEHPFATGIDTGCVYGHALTALSLPERRFYSVPARGPTAAR